MLSSERKETLVTVHSVAHPGQYVSISEGIPVKKPELTEAKRNMLPRMGDLPALVCTVTNVIAVIAAR